MYAGIFRAGAPDDSLDADPSADREGISCIEQENETSIPGETCGRI
jgi:hypothetical protein